MAELFMTGALIIIVILCILTLSKLKKKTDHTEQLRSELSSQFRMLAGMMMETMNKAAGANSQNVDLLRRTVEEKLSEIQRSVDRKLDTTLRSGLSASFERVNEQLKQVYQSMGEMRELTSGVGDLKKLLSNVKTRGIWGEVQLHKLLSDFMAPGQYEENAKIKGDNSVEFAVRMPCEEGSAALLPIDSKFPLDRYVRILELAEDGDPEQRKYAKKEFASAVLAEAKKIHEKYIFPPKTTNFAIMFLPSEGLYAEIIRVGLVETLQNKYKVMVAGPSTLGALLTSLQMGFKSLTIRQHSTTVIDMLAAIKNEFEQFALLLQKTQHSLQAAQNHLEAASRRSAKIQKKLADAERWDSGE
jgi:DNA recombination protein RmuC